MEYYIPEAGDHDPFFDLVDIEREKRKEIEISIEIAKLTN